MKRTSLLISAACAAFATLAQAQPFQTGMRELTIEDPAGARDLTGFLWYPTLAEAPMGVDFDSKVWKSSPVILDAAPTGQSFPLIVVSHGMFGNAYNQAWFGAAMSKRGYVVAAISHPGTSTWLRDADQRRALWERPKDVSRVIDHVTTPGALPIEVLSDQVFMAGHSLGGFTAALLAGARYDADQLESFCDGRSDEMVCGIFADWDIAKTPQDRTQMEADLADPRIRAFALFDLGGTQSFSPQSLAKIDSPLLVFGAPITNSGLDLDIESRALVKELPSQNTHYIEPETLSHFDFLGQCKPGGFELLAKEEPGDEIICSNGGPARAQKHEMIIQEVSAFFKAS